VPGAADVGSPTDHLHHIMRGHTRWFIYYQYT